ncbi:MAG: hypothetical protein QGH24_01255 [Candidatus Marinimicrobia bacterium]|jgi:hypothetical protein|nr:hypothetical protein [Candidatus Neomarinimicrobiota bacterium]MDP6755412.1 hypothetical protein [Candidatus Neomarinimicrobiota bacterium]|tara:strand:+ start:218 stop:424 length:207 start_codon:yes stop_codon:yes gene_type:complete
MANKPQKPLTKKKETTVKWTKNADNRLSKIEKELLKIEKKLEALIKKTSSDSATKPPSKIVYSLRKKS